MASKNPVSPPPLGTNHDLWVIPPSAHSQWFARIDWYLNWQMSKGLAFQRQKPPAELLRVLEDAGIAYEPEHASDGAPLMVASGGKVGSERCVVVDFGGKLPAWLHSVHGLCKDLQCRRTRVFLPRGSSKAEAETLWTKLTPLDVQLEFSTDEDNAT
jgi:hypothetical protein